MFERLPYIYYGGKKDMEKNAKETTNTTAADIALDVCLALRQCASGLESAAFAAQSMNCVQTQRV